MHQIPDDPRRVAGPDELDSDFGFDDPMDRSDEAYEQLRDESIMEGVLRMKQLADNILAPVSVATQFSQVFGDGK